MMMVTIDDNADGNDWRRRLRDGDNDDDIDENADDNDGDDEEADKVNMMKRERYERC